MPHWNWPGKEGQNIRVIAFSNCQRVELVPQRHRASAPRTCRATDTWNGRSNYAPGNVTAKGYDAEGLAATDIGGDDRRAGRPPVEHRAARR